MFDRLISRFRIWQFAQVCRRDPAQIGLELRRMLADLQGPARWSRAQNLMRPGLAGACPPALTAVAAFRWRITDNAVIARIFESLTEEEQDRIRSAISLIPPHHLG